MTNGSESAQNELARRHRRARLIVAAFLALTIVLIAIAYFASGSVHRGGDARAEWGLWIAILVFGMGAFVLRRTKFSTLRLRDIAALQGITGLLRTLEGTTLQVAYIGGAIALMGFMITIISGNWTDMLRAGGVALVVLIYGYPVRHAWERAVRQLTPDRPAL